MLTKGATLDLQECYNHANKPLWCGSPVKINGGATLTATNSMFAQPSFAGGAIDISGAGSELRLHQSTFAQNLARNGNGGAIAVTQGAQVSISDNVWFTGNRADNSGGAIHVTDSGSVIEAHSNIVFSDNIGTVGGAVAATGNNVHVALRQTHITGTNRAFRGGALFVGDDAALSLYHSAVTGGHATNGGGIFVSVGGVANLSSCTLTGNTATGSGGAMEARTDSSITLLNTSIQGNVADAAGVRLEFASVWRRDKVRFQHTEHHCLIRDGGIAPPVMRGC